ncbi:membrane-spanning 4-domains subfamily A member 4A-like [Hoplias malabaricus]|uniref:membrane-spanning 4-domains subfamily A member 4A-like n=1 Tax=Hoplias malabaricus TaxID=27720 RepID=UPI003462EE8F
MATSFVPVSNTKNGFTIVTQVVPGPPGKTGSNISTPGPVQRLLKGEPKALGTVQIMIGITTFLFGITLTVNMFTVSDYSFVTFCGPVIYIISGALSVAVGNKAHPCVVKASLTMNVISSVIAGAVIIFLSFGIYASQWYFWYCTTDGYRSSLAQSLYNGMYGVLMVFSLLETIISIYSAAFICRVSCCPEIMTAQIVIGIMNLLFGIVSTLRLEAPFFITSGVLSVVAGIKAHSSLVTVSLVMNVISSVIAGVAIVLLLGNIVVLQEFKQCAENSSGRSDDYKEYGPE